MTDYTAPSTYVAPVSPPKPTTPAKDASTELNAALENLASKDTPPPKKLADVVAGIEGFRIDEVLDIGFEGYLDIN